MTTAFVLSGGANLGAVQVGMLKALLEANVRPDMLIGTSVGAINAAWIAGADPSEGVDELVEIWRSLRRSDIFPMRFGVGLAGFLGKRESFTGSSGLRKLIESNVRFDRLEEAPIPLHVVVTDVLDGHDLALSEGSASDVITASAAIPGACPAVVIGGRAYMDGGVVNNARVVCRGVRRRQGLRAPYRRCVFARRAAVLSARNDPARHNSDDQQQAVRRC